MIPQLDKIPAKFWTDVVLGTIDDQYEFLALKIALSHHRMQARRGADAAREAGEQLRVPITFGEIAFQLLNQTLVYLDVKSING